MLKKRLGQERATWDQAHKELKFQISQLQAKIDAMKVEVAESEESKCKVEKMLSDMETEKDAFIKQVELLEFSPSSKSAMPDDDWADS